MACECISCHDCGGSGHYYVDIGGRYIGQHRIDDLSDMETCEECGGSGISETCCECQEAMCASEDEHERRQIGGQE